MHIFLSLKFCFILSFKLCFVTLAFKAELFEEKRDYGLTRRWGRWIMDGKRFCLSIARRFLNRMDTRMELAQAVELTQQPLSKPAQK